MLWEDIIVSGLIVVVQFWLKPYHRYNDLFFEKSENLCHFYLIVTFIRDFFYVQPAKKILCQKESHSILWYHSITLDLKVLNMKMDFYTGGSTTWFWARQWTLFMFFFYLARTTNNNMYVKIIVNFFLRRLLCIAWERLRRIKNILFHH